MINNLKQNQKLKKIWAICTNKFVVAAVLLAIILAVVIPISILGAQRLEENFKNGAIVSNSKPCADVGIKILTKYGNAVDALIATMLCDGVGTMNNMGLGGGFVATLYLRKTETAITINARETAPSKANANMFKQNATLSSFGGLSVAVPGEIMGYWEMYKKYGGKAPWKELFQPTIQLCREGVPINQNVAANIASTKESILQSPTLCKILLNDKGELPKEGDKVKLIKLAGTLEVIAENGPDVLYNGSLSLPLINDINKNGGIMTLDDLANYRVKWTAPVQIDINPGLTMFSTPAPASGSVLNYIMELVNNIIPTGNKFRDAVIITEAFKNAYAERSKLGDPNFVDITKEIELLKDPKFIKSVRAKLDVNHTSNDPNTYGADYLKEDHGTSNIVILAPNGDAIAVTSTINLIFGSKLVSESTGIILNDEMDDFSSPGISNAFGVDPSPANFIHPGARPFSSMCPTIFIDKNTKDVRLVIGAAGGTKITTSVVQVAIKNLWLKMNISESIRTPRYHHQLLPMTWYYEKMESKDLVEHMKLVGHNVTESPVIRSCVTAISKDGNEIMASSDFRRPGSVAYIVKPV